MIHQVKGLEKQVGIYMIPNRNWSLIITRLSNKGILKWFTKKGNQNKILWRSHHSSYFKKKDTVNKTDKPQASNKIVDTPKRNKTDTVK